MYDIQARARIEAQRVRMNETMAAIFDEVDFVFASTNPDVAFGCQGPLPTTVNGTNVGPGNNGALTIPSNIFGNPAMQIPAGRCGACPSACRYWAAPPGATPPRARPHRRADPTLAAHRALVMRGQSNRTGRASGPRNA